MNLPQLLPSAPHCRSCDLGAGCRNPGIPTRHWDQSLPPSPATTALICVGMNPGYFEDAANTCFVGKSGQILTDSYLKGESLHSLSSIYLTNAARCYSPADPPAKAFRTCFPLYTFHDILSLSAFHSRTFLLLLGNAAVTSFYASFPRPALRASKLTSNPARPTLAWSIEHPAIPVPLPDPASPTPPRTALVFATYHPAYIMRAPAAIHAVAAHLSLLRSTLLNLTPPQSTPTLVPPFSPR